MKTETEMGSRLLSLDALRGFDMLFIMGLSTILAHLARKPAVSRAKRRAHRGTSRENHKCFLHCHFLFLVLPQSSGNMATRNFAQP